MKNKYLIALLFISTMTCWGAVRVLAQFSYNTHGSVANYFENEQQFITFFDFKSGETMAEIGAGNGGNMKGFNLVADSAVFYVQDIDDKTLSQKAFLKVTSTAKSANTFHRIIGTENESKLPDNSFNKIMLISTFHEFSDMDGMMADIYQKLVTGGKLYILESHCYTASHKNYTADETQAIIEKQAFRLVKKEEGDINGSKGLYRLVFEKK